MEETQVWSLGREDPLEQVMATHSSILAWRIPWTEKPGGLQSMGSHRVRHEWSDLAAAACPLSQWCHPTISSSVAPLSSCLQSVPASRSFPKSQPFTSGGQSTGASASASVLPINILSWFPLGLTCLISLLSKRLSRVFSSTTVQKQCSAFLWSNFHIHTWLLEKSLFWLYGLL